MRFLLVVFLALITSPVRGDGPKPSVCAVAAAPLSEGPSTVIKIGGNEAEDPAFLARLAQVLSKQSQPTVIVHGGGKTINRMLDAQGIEAVYHNGQRVTDDATMEVVECVLCGPANKRLVRAMLEQGVPAIGLSGMDNRIIEVESADPRLGRVGKPVKVNPQPLRELSGLGYLPILSPVSIGATDNRSYNVNADIAASAVANGLGAKQLTFLTNVPGVKINGEVAPVLTVAEVKQAITDGHITGGMIPKVQAALDAVEAGVAAVKIANLDTFVDGGTIIRK